MASAVSVTSAPSVPFRRFLPHEKPLAPPVRPLDYHADDIAEEQDMRFIDRSPPQMLSDEDMSVLMEARLAAEEDSWERTHLHAPWHKEWSSDWHQPESAADREYLPFAFALAARSYS